MSLLTICPYTLKSVSQLSEKSREHIIPDAKGGPDGFVYAEKLKMDVSIMRLMRRLQMKILSECLLSCMA